jgi:hypothetical protein
MQLNLYHGTNQRFVKFEQSKARIANDYYGGGVAYFTDNLDIAKGYASSMQKKSGGDKLIYQVVLNIMKLFDVDQKFSGKDLMAFIDKKSSEEFARGAGLLSLGSDKYKVLDELESGRMVLTGDQVFKGLSQGMNKTAQAREKLKKLGYDALRYNGGAMGITAQKHNVYIAYDANKIRIIEPRMIVASETQIKESGTGDERYKLI